MTIMLKKLVNRTSGISRFFNKSGRKNPEIQNNDGI